MLRTEWLRARSRLFDTDVALPTLTAVLDDVRRLLEQRGSLGVFYFELTADPGHEARRGWQVVDAHVRAFATALLQLRGAILETEALIAIGGVRGEAFLVFSAGASTESLDPDSLAARSARLAARLVRSLEAEARATGAVDFQHGFAPLSRDPMMRTERAIQRAIDGAFLMALTRRDREDDHRAADLDAILSGGGIRTLWQAVMSLSERRVVGRQAFSHGPTDGPFADFERLLSLAERTGRLVQLERACHRQALGSLGSGLPAGQKVFLSSSAHTLREGLAGPEFAAEVRQAGLQCTDVVIEIAERQTRDAPSRTRDAVAQLKRAGFAIAIADMGAGHSSLRSIVELEPDYIKFDVALVRGIDRSLIQRSLLETLVELSGKIAAPIIAEGIASESELATLREMGVELGQGDHLSQPRAADDDEPAP